MKIPGEALRAERRARKWSQEELLKRMGTAGKRYKQWEVTRWEQRGQLEAWLIAPLDVAFGGGEWRQAYAEDGAELAQLRETVRILAMKVQLNTMAINLLSEKAGVLVRRRLAKILGQAAPSEERLPRDG
jgi:transcriptional regulator with XRE-family HTH domain